MLRLLAILMLGLQPLVGGAAIAFQADGDSAAGASAAVNSCCCASATACEMAASDACGCVEPAPTPQRTPTPIPTRGVELPTILTDLVAAIILDEPTERPALRVSARDGSSGRSHNDIRALLGIWRT